LKTAPRIAHACTGLALAALLAGCSYSFTGSSVPAHLKSIHIAVFDDLTNSGEPAVREDVTNRLIERFRQDNSLDVTDQAAADCGLEGSISSFTDLPTVVAAGEAVQKARITIGVHAVFTDQKLKKKVYDKTFTAWGEYDIGADPAIRKEAVTAAIEKLTEDILLESVSGW
jgi:Lipopolysaccharide-assembly